MPPQGMPPSNDKALDKSLKTLSIDSTPLADSWEDEASDISESEAPPPDSASPDLDSSTNIPQPNTVKPASSQTSKPLDKPTSSVPNSSRRDLNSQADPVFLPYGGSISNSASSATTSTSLARNRNGSSETSAPRPEKTNAVASRLIAGALGVKAPRRTEEQRAYDRAARETEKKRREKERDEVKMRAEAAERAKNDIWGD